MATKRRSNKNEILKKLNLIRGSAIPLRKKLQRYWVTHGAKFSQNPTSTMDGDQDPSFKLTPTMQKIMKTCRKKSFKGEVIANKVGLDYEYIRKLLSTLVKANYLKKDENGYRSACPRV